MWTWTALCADTKLVPSWLVGERTTDDALVFMTDLRDRLASRVQMTTDGHRAYWTAVGLTFGRDIDHAILQKLYSTDYGTQGRYSPAICTGTKTTVLRGDPDPQKINTSYVERQNLTMPPGRGSRLAMAARRQCRVPASDALEAAARSARRSG